MEETAPETYNRDVKLADAPAASRGKVWKIGIFRKLSGKRRRAVRPAKRRRRSRLGNARLSGEGTVDQRRGEAKTVRLYEARSRRPLDRSRSIKDF